MTSQTKQENYWTKSDKEAIIKVLTILCDGQKSYGKQIELKNIFSYYDLKLNGRFSARQVINALNAYTDKHNDMPAPADIINIIDPVITEAQYVSAQKWQERNGYPIFSDAKDIIEKYEKQNNPCQAENERISAILKNALPAK